MWLLFFCFKQKTAYDVRISDWSSDVCSSDLQACGDAVPRGEGHAPFMPHYRDRRRPGVGQHRAFVEHGHGSDVIGDRRAGGWVHAEGEANARLLAKAAIVAGGGDRHAAKRYPQRREPERSEEHTSELQSLMHISYAVF